jgi:hypothetical protein
VAVDASSGSVYITGVAQADVAFSSANGSAHSVPGVETWHVFLAKYNTQGNFQWGPGEYGRGQHRAAQK